MKRSLPALSPRLRTVGLTAALLALGGSLLLRLDAAVQALGAPAMQVARVLELLAFALLAGWLLLHWLGHRPGAGEALASAPRSDPALQADRALESVFRAAREVQRHPDRHVARLGQLLSELFEPVELRRSARDVERATLAESGRALLLPVPALTGVPGSASATLMLRVVEPGRRRFTAADARLADRLVEQLAGAVAHDLAVERGRTEERLRIAQDLHDDIGARLLTLMYQAPNAEMEDYLRHTLKDLKTLTRGLAAGPQRLSEAAVEWKADVASRLGAAGLELDFQVRHDADPLLTVVQWSALTRILRELVSNVLAHAQAQRVDVRLVLAAGHLVLTVTDDGRGGDPARWAAGLGLGGVRKRVKLLGGEVAWRPGTDADGPRGITCEVRVRRFDESAGT